MNNMMYFIIIIFLQLTRLAVQQCMVEEKNLNPLYQFCSLFLFTIIFTLMPPMMQEAANELEYT